VNTGNCNGALLLLFRLAAATLPVSAPCRVSVPLVVVADADELDADELDPDELQAATARPATDRPASAVVVTMACLMMPPPFVLALPREGTVRITLRG
jgi:hypothetical protein